MRVPFRNKKILKKLVRRTEQKNIKDIKITSFYFVQKLNKKQNKKILNFFKKVIDKEKMVC